MADPQPLAAAIVAALGNAAAAGPPAGPFALAPALTLHGPLDYTKKADAAIFQAAVKAISTPFDLQKPNLTALVEALHSKATTFGWDDVLVATIGAQRINILDRYGRITHDQAATWVGTYINQPQRPAQNDYQLYACLLASLTPDTLNALTNEKNKYHVAGANAADPRKVSGFMLLKCILSKVVHTRRQWKGP